MLAANEHFNLAAFETNDKVDGCTVLNNLNGVTRDKAGGSLAVKSSNGPVEFGSKHVAGCTTWRNSAQNFPSAVVIVGSASSFPKARLQRKQFKLVRVGESRPGRLGYVRINTFATSAQAESEQSSEQLSRHTAPLNHSFLPKSLNCSASDVNLSAARGTWNKFSARLATADFDVLTRSNSSSSR
jgi:hypothetical protein